MTWLNGALLYHMNSFWKSTDCNEPKAAGGETPLTRSRRNSKQGSLSIFLGKICGYLKNTEAGRQMPKLSQDVTLPVILMYLYGT
jgi:hypothetical protein